MEKLLCCLTLEAGPHHRAVRFLSQPLSHRYRKSQFLFPALFPFWISAAFRSAILVSFLFTLYLVGICLASSKTSLSKNGTFIEYNTGISHKEQQQIIFLSGKRNLFLSPHNCSRRSIDLQPLHIDLCLKFSMTP